MDFTHAGDMIGENALGIEMAANAVNIGKTIRTYPMLGKSTGMAAEVAHVFVPICRHSKRGHGKHG